MLFKGILIYTLLRKSVSLDVCMKPNHQFHVELRSLCISLSDFPIRYAVSTSCCKTTR